jgi:hypothetical protein
MLAGMPTPAARALFADAQKLMDALRALQDRKHALVEQLRYAPTREELTALHERVDSMRGVAAELSRQYANAVDRYVDAVRDSLAVATPVVR